jgi:hypothetical protein
MNPESHKPSNRPYVWPTSRRKFLELLLGFCPGWLVLVGIAIAVLLPLIQSCRQAIN